MIFQSDFVFTAMMEALFGALTVFFSNIFATILGIPTA